MITNKDIYILRIITTADIESPNDYVLGYAGDIGMLIYPTVRIEKTVFERFPAVCIELVAQLYTAQRELREAYHINDHKTYTKIAKAIYPGDFTTVEQLLDKLRVPRCFECGQPVVGWTIRDFGGYDVAWIIKLFGAKAVYCNICRPDDPEFAHVNRRSHE